MCAVNRCRLLCCCASNNRQTANAFEDVANLISDYFHVCFSLADDDDELWMILL